MHPYLAYRVLTLEIAEAARLAERHRMAAEHAEQFVRRPTLRDQWRAICRRRGDTSSAGSGARRDLRPLSAKLRHLPDGGEGP